MKIIVSTCIYLLQNCIKTDPKNNNFESLTQLMLVYNQDIVANVKMMNGLPAGICTLTHFGEQRKVHGHYSFFRKSTLWCVMGESLRL